MKNNLDTLILYSCGTCNLHCKYCGIDKNPVLGKIDEVLAESFKGDYYFNQIKKYFPNRGQLRRIETWGGEPFLHMERVHHVLHQVINEYPYFDTMYSSTNFSYPSWLNQFFSLMEQFGKYPYRDFKFELQLSVDGPTEINDENRGRGTTKKCLENYNKLIEALSKNKLPENVELSIALKATLDNNNIHKLNNKEAIIDYYQWFEENFDKPFYEACLPDRISYYTAHPNTAVPSPVTKEDGLVFANVCKLCREIEEENKEKHYFKYRDIITFFAMNNVSNELTYNYPNYTCGTGYTMIGLLPDGMISTCHEGFTHFIEEYKKLASTSDRVNTSTINFDKFLNEEKLPFCVDEKGFKEHCRKMSLYNDNNAKARVGVIASQIVGLALAGQVDKRFLYSENAVKGAIFIQNHTSYCIKDNYTQTGSYLTVPTGLLKLLLNGAMDYIQNGEELKIEKGDKCYGCGLCK